MGFLIKQGFYKTDDIGLLHRSLQAVRVFELGQRLEDDAANMTFDELKLVADLEKRASKRKRKK